MGASIGPTEDKVMLPVAGAHSEPILIVAGSPLAQHGRSVGGDSSVGLEEVPVSGRLVVVGADTVIIARYI
jgi:hypothetical protein